MVRDAYYYALPLLAAAALIGWLTGPLWALPAVLLAAFFARYVSWRLGGIIEYARQLAEGNFRARLGGVSRGELGVLAGKLNETSEKLEFMLERLEPQSGSELSAGDIYLAYKRWCREKQAVALKRHDLLEEFAAYATKAGIPFSGTSGWVVYRDVTLSE